MDLIDRKMAIDALGERPMVWTDSDYEIAQRNQYDMDKLAIETVPSAQPERDTGYSDGFTDGYKAGQKEAQPEPQWIPCSERLPYAEYGESDTVLTTCGYRDVEDTSVRWTRLLYFNGGNWCYPTGETYEAKVYAWMPLPESYKGE